MTQPTALFLADVIDADCMNTQPEPLRLADAIDPLTRQSLDNLTCSVAAAELRRLHAENERLAELVCDYAAEEAPDALRTLAADRDRWHTKAEKAEAQRDALLEALRRLLSYANVLEMRLTDADGEHGAMQQARSAIAKAEGENA